MKSLLLASLLLALLAGCTPNIQVVTLRGSNVQPAQEGLVLDNDTLTLRYNFASERGRMHLSIINKLNQPLYIDWKRSSFIIGQQKLDYWYDVANVNLLTSGYAFRYRNTGISSTRSSTNGVILKDDPIAFIPSHTETTKQRFVVLPEGTIAMSGTGVVSQEQARWTPNPKKTVAVRTYTYSMNQSPLQFRNYLTLSTDKDFKTEFFIDTQFWVSDVRVEPQPQAIDVVKKQPDGSYVSTKSFAQKDGFFVFLSEKK